MHQNQRTARFCLSFALVALLSAPLCAAETSSYQFRGPNRDGKSTDTGLLKEWPKEGPQLVWTAKGLGKGFSSVSMADGKIYTMGEVGSDSVVHCLNAADGSIAWTTRIGKPGGGGGYPGTRCTPTISGKHLYVLGEQGEAACLAREDGKVVWTKNMKEFGGSVPTWGYAESPLVDGDTVIVTPGGKKGTMLALNAQTGATLWQSKDWTDGAHYSSAIAVDHGGKRQYVQLTAASVAGIDAATGDVLWKAERKGNTAVIPNPVWHDGHVYVTSGYGIGCDLFKVDASGGKFSVTPVYTKNKVMVNHHGGVILHEGKIYGYSDGKGWSCQDFMSGDVVWKDKDALGKGTITYADGMFYLRDEAKGKGTVVLIEASPEGFKEHGRFLPPNQGNAQSWPHLVVSGGKLYYRDQDLLHCYDVKAK